MSMKSQRRGFRKWIRVMAMLAALLAACALLTQCTAGNSAVDKDSDVEGMKNSATPKATPKPTPSEGNIPPDVKTIIPPQRGDSMSYCITKDESGKLVCQMWKSLSLQKEWKLPEKILEVGDFKVMSVECYADKNDGEVFTCRLDYDDGMEVLGLGQKPGVFYIQKAGKELIIVYNSYVTNQSYFTSQKDLTFTTSDGKVFRVYTRTDAPFNVYCWQLNKGIYMDFDEDWRNNMIYSKGRVMRALPCEASYDESTGEATFDEPFDKPTIPEWNDVEE